MPSNGYKADERGAWIGTQPLFEWIFLHNSRINSKLCQKRVGKAQLPGRKVQIDNVCEKLEFLGAIMEKIISQFAGLLLCLANKWGLLMADWIYAVNRDNITRKSAVIDQGIYREKNAFGAVAAELPTKKASREKRKRRIDWGGELRNIFFAKLWGRVELMRGCPSARYLHGQTPVFVFFVFFKKRKKERKVINKLSQKVTYISLYLKLR